MKRPLQLAVALLSCIAALTETFSPLSNQHNPKQNFIAQPGNATFDYVIIGGGTAGLTVAARLAESDAISVAVIEAGGFYEVDSGNVSVVPGYCTYYAGTDPKDTDPKIDWNFVTTPQTARCPDRKY